MIYGNIKRVISVFIVNEEMFYKDALLHYRFRFADRHADIDLSDFMEINILELSKARKKNTIDTPLDAWLKFLAADEKEEFIQLAEHNAGLRSACMVLKELSADEQTHLIAEQREKAWRDEMDRLEGAIEEGVQEGIQIGIEKRDQDHIEQMYKKGLSPELISNYIEIPIDKVKKILGLK